MKLRLEDKHSAIDLRKNGYTYSEIMGIIPNLSKGTLSGWLKNIDLSPEQKTRIKEKILTGAEKARIKGAWSNKNKAVLRIAAIKEAAEKEFLEYSTDPLFNIFLSVYWAEGAKKSRNFQFINSDPRMLKLVLKCLRTLFKIPEEDIKIRLFIHKVYSEENCESYWSNITDIPVERFQKTTYKPTLHRVKKNPTYKGCCRIELTKSEFYWKVEKWIDMLSSNI